MKIGIVGLGFVGLSLASVLASKGYNTVGIDIDKEKCEKISNGNSPFFEPNLEKILRNGLKKKLTVSNDFSLIKDCDMIFLTVGTPQSKNGSIELTMIKKSVKVIGKILRENKKNPIVIIKSTVIPGTTQKMILPILEKESGLSVKEDFYIAFAPERTVEGEAIQELKILPQIIGGYN